MPKAGARWFGRMALALGAVYLLWIAGQAVSFKRPGPAAAASIERAGEPFPFEIRGVYHVHTTHSDGRKTVEEVAGAAARAGLDFVVLTDHGAPNRESMEARGRYGRVLVLAGSEISTSRGHLVALGFDPPEHPFPQRAEDAALEVAARGGFTIIAHPYAKTSWSWGGEAGYGGIEIINGDGDLRGDWLASIPDLPLLLVRPSLALLKALDPPRATVRKWDEMLARGGRLPFERPALGAYASDAHGYFLEASLGLLNLRLPLEAPLPEDFAAAESIILDALRSGRFHNAVEAAADATGFRFGAEGGGTTVRIRARTPFSFAHETRIIRDGTMIASGTGPELVVAAAGSGIYRAEVHLAGRTPLRRGVPWILSNPIVVREGTLP